MKFGVVNKSTTVNRFVLHTLQCNITHLAVKTRKTNIKLGILKGGTGKEPKLVAPLVFCQFHTPSKLFHNDLFSSLHPRRYTHPQLNSISE